uniref:C2H2-type domain-containing protein n=1 Tax=Macrostomum lignano TaxID=282301 RepID=A0A1I8FEF7_9PLAT
LKAETGFEHRHLSTDCSPTVSQRCAGLCRLPVCPRRFCRTPTGSGAILASCAAVTTELATTRSLRRRLRPTQKLAERRRSSRSASRNESAMKPCTDGSRAKPFQCDTCQKKFSRRSYLNAHISVVHRKATPHKCKRENPICTCTGRLTLVRDRFECKVCGKRFSDSSSLTTHSRQQHRRKAIKLKVCGKRFSHTEKSPFECKVCGKRSVSAAALLHTPGCIQEKSHLSAKCGKRFSVSRQPTTHSRQHTGEKPFECKVCGKRFSEKSHLSGKVCGKRFSVSSSLTTHSRQHTGEKPFECKSSGKRFSDQHNLTTHSRLHTGEKPFECKVWRQEIHAKRDLHVHSRLTLVRRPHLKCKVCGKRSVSAAALLHTPGCIQEKSHLRAKCAARDSVSVQPSYYITPKAAYRRKPIECKKSHLGARCGAARDSVSAAATDITPGCIQEKKPLKCKCAARDLCCPAAISLGTQACTQRKAIECKVPARDSVSASHFTRHLRLHTGKKSQFECKQEIQVTAAPYYTLPAGTQEKKPFECKVCGKRFSVGSHLTSTQSAQNRRKAI